MILNDLKYMSNSDFQNALIEIQLDIMNHILLNKIKEGKTVFSGTITQLLN